MRPIIYISYIESMFFQDITTQILDWTRAGWGRRDAKGVVVEHPTIRTSFDMRHASPVEKFNQLAESDIFVVICPLPGTEDEGWLFDIKAMAALINHKPRLLYAIIKKGREWRLYKANFVAGMLREVNE